MGVADKAKAKQPPMGTISQPIDPPEQAGTISVGEAAEIRERKRLIEAAQDRFKVTQDDLADQAKIIQLLRVENRKYLESLCETRGLDLRDGYDVASESGIIWRTAKAVEATTAVAESVPVTPEEPVANGT